MLFRSSIEALNDPRFKGRVVVNDPRALPASRPWYLAVLQKYGEGFLKELGSHAAMAPNAATAMQHLVSGLMGIYAPAVLPSVNEAIQSGATLNFAILDPVVVNKTVAAIPAKAPHPAAARLLLNYWMSVEGQEVFSRRSYTLMPGVLGTSVLPSYVDVDAEAGERELGRINALLGIG